MKKTLLLLPILILFVGCGDDSSTSSSTKKCGTCLEYQQCNTTTNQCELKTDRCLDNTHCSGNTDGKVICDIAAKICIAPTTDPCDDITCSGHGVCGAQGNQALCVCNDGYHADGLTCIVNDITDPCKGVTCSGHGTCGAQGTIAICICNTGYTVQGLNCIADDPCTDVTCQSHATCDAGFCQCDTGYHASGNQCILNDPCANITCQTNATCNAGICQCDSGYHADGDQCIINQSDQLYPGDITITEIMANPKQVGDTSGEWIELYNKTAQTIDLTELKIIRGSNEYKITSGATDIAAKSYFVIARSENAVIDYDAVGNISLVNSALVLSIKIGDVTLDQVSSFDATDGKSWQFDGSQWCVATETISNSNSDLGTPKTQNSSCDVIDPCANVTCQAHATCNNGICSCDSGYSASGDQCIANDPCSGVTCNSWETCNAGSCDLLSGKCNDRNDCSGDLICGGLDSHSCVASEAGLTPISDIQQDLITVGEVVKVKGMITAIDNNSIWIQETGTTHAGLNLYGTDNVINPTTVAPGDEVIVEGAYQSYKGLAELENLTSFERTGINNGVPAPTLLTAAQMGGATAEPYEAMLVEIRGDLELTNVMFSDTEWDINTTVTDHNTGNSFVIRGTIWRHRFEEGTKLTAIRGVISQYDTIYQLFPRFEADFAQVGDLCFDYSCDPGSLCAVQNGAAICVCDTDAHYYNDGNGGCKNSCLSYGTNPCTAAHKSLCDPTGPGVNDHTCSCEFGYEELGDGTCYAPECFTIRTMAANTTSGSDQAYEGPGIRIFQAIKPDIAMVQEFNYKLGTMRSFIDTAFGTEYHYSRGVGQIPNGIVSRYPITDFGAWTDPNISNRDLDWAIVDLPATDRDLFVISVHLHTKPSSDQVIAAQVIAKEVAAIKNAQPGKYYFMVGGDFNGSSSVNSTGFGYYDGTATFYTSGPHPVGEDGYDGTNISRAKDYDWILPGIDLKPLQIPVEVVNPNNTSDSITYYNGLIFDTRDFTQSKLNTYFSPALEDDSNAYDDKNNTTMQHMSIIKDFSNCPK